MTIQINTDNLELNKIYKYKELCEILAIEIKKTTNGKNSQIKELECLLNIKKDKTKYTVTEIYKTPLQKVEFRGGSNKTEYIKVIELLILDLLVQDKNNGNVFLSKNKLMKSLAMINDNYAYCKERIPKLSKFTGIQKQTVEEWYLSTDGMLKRNLEKALDNLRSQSLVIWSSELTVCDLVPIGINENEQNLNINKQVLEDEYGEKVTEYKLTNQIDYEHREATIEEKRFILRTERETMESMGCTSKQEVIRNSMWSEFKETVDNIILDELKIAYYYNSYKIICNEDHIIKQRNKLMDLLLTEEDRKIHCQLLNGDISKKLHSNVENKQKRALKKDDDCLGEHSDKKVVRRIKSTYIDDNNTLTDTLINKDSKNINNKVRKIKPK